MSRHGEINHFIVIIIIIIHYFHSTDICSCIIQIVRRNKQAKVPIDTVRGKDPDCSSTTDEVDITPAVFLDHPYIVHIHKDEYSQFLSTVIWTNDPESFCMRTEINSMKNNIRLQ